MKITDLSTREEFEIEALREDLRDRRWRRHKSMLITGFGLVPILAFVGPLPPLTDLPWV